MEEVKRINETVNATTCTDEIKRPEKKSYDGFLFLPSYRESFDCLIKAGEHELAALLLQAIVAYGTEGEVITDDPRVEIVMVSIRRSIDSQRKNYNEKKLLRKMREEQFAIQKRVNTTFL